MLSDQKIIMGIDEVGRGPLAGPVVAAAVILHEGHATLTIKDSKKLSNTAIRQIAHEIQQVASYGIALASVAEIEELNILQATMLAMRRAAAQVTKHYDVVHVDGNRNPWQSSLKVRLMIKGDTLCRTIAAASIIAKAYRDQLMEELHIKHPEYQWYQNKGYGTKKHIEAIQRHGVVAEHRGVFCRKIMAQT
jgi:ribonuclease HII